MQFQLQKTFQHNRALHKLLACSLLYSTECWICVSPHFLESIWTRLTVPSTSTTRWNNQSFERKISGLLVLSNQEGKAWCNCQTETHDMFRFEHFWICVRQQISGCKLCWFVDRHGFCRTDWEERQRPSPFLWPSPSFPTQQWAQYFRNEEPWENICLFVQHSPPDLGACVLSCLRALQRTPDNCLDALHINGLA